MTLLKVACAGGANIDIQGFSNAKMNLRDSNPGVIRFCPGGVGRNIAENMARLGLSVTMVSAVGADAFGESILSSCRAAGMDTSAIEVIPGARSSSYLVLTDSDGDMLAAISDMHIIKGLGADFIRHHSAVFDAADIIVLDPNLSPEALDALTAGWQAKPIFADPISETYAGVLLPFLPRLHTVKCNRQEAAILAGIPIQNDADLDRAAELLLRTGLKRAVITLGSEGVYYRDCTGLRLKKCHEPVEAVSATGAGDAFTGAMVYAYAAGLSAEESLELAMRAAEITLRDKLTVSPKVNQCLSGIAGL